MDQKNNHGQRSEKVRAILGEIPKPLVRAGIIVIFTIFVVLILCISLITYPYSDGTSILAHIIRTIF